MMGVMGMSIAVPLVYQNFPSFIAGAGVWALGAYILRLAAKNDPQMRHVYRRSLKYKGYLPAQAHYDAPYPKSK
jgi:type IV secretory pathway TrbD component